MTLNPALALPYCVLTATVSLINYPTVTYSQNITAIVEGGKIPGAEVQSVPALAQPKPLSIATMTLNATINKEAFLELPKLNASYSYLVTSKQTF